MKTLEQFEAEQAAAKALFLAELDLVASVPEGIKVISNMTSKTPWVCYDVNTVDEALAIIEKCGDLLDVECVTAGCTSVSPHRYQGKHYVDVPPRWTVPQCIEVSQSVGKGFASFEIEAFPASPQCRIHINVKNFPYEHRVRVDAKYNRAGDPINVHITGGENLKRRADQYLSFGGGGRDHADRRFYFAGLDKIRAAFAKEEQK